MSTRILLIFSGLLLAAPSLHARGRRSNPAPTRKAWLGTALATLTRVDRRQKGVPKYGGVLIQRVVKGSPAALTGFRPGDVIMRLDNKYVYKPKDIIRRVAAATVNRHMKIDIIRNGRWMTARVKLLPRPRRIPGAPASRPADPPPRRHHAVTKNPFNRRPPPPAQTPGIADRG